MKYLPVDITWDICIDTLPDDLTYKYYLVNLNTWRITSPQLTQEPHVCSPVIFERASR